MHYKDLEPNKWAKIAGWGDAAAARKLITEAIDRANPVIWAVHLGIVPEPDIPQAQGGHIRLIIGYNPQTDEVYDMQQAIKVVRAYAEDWGIDPKKIGAIGFSAGAELSAPAALLYPEFDRIHSTDSDPFAGTTSRPDFTAHG